MDVVLYTEDFEPITVFDLPVMPDQIARYMGGRFNVAIDEPLPDTPWNGECRETIVFRTLTIRLEPLRWLRGEHKWVFIAEDEVLALQLRASWLPGQHAQVNDYQRTINIFAQALLRSMLGGGEL